MPVYFQGYKVGKLLGEGTFGQTHEAEKDGVRVALKLFREEVMQSDIDVKRFMREVRALEKVNSPCVVKLLDSGFGTLGQENRYYIAMEYLEGQDLGKAFHSADNEFTELRLKGMLHQIIMGLKAIHEQNIVHRDLKPANIFICPNDSIKLLDFGLVKMLDYTTLTSRPRPAIGTPFYIAPEIIRGERADTRADFYSFGILLFYLITKGNYPFSAQSFIELARKVVDNPPEYPTKYNNQISSEFENLVLMLLSKQPYERTLDHDELMTAIKITPLTRPERIPAAASPARKDYPKSCLFRLMHTEKGEIETFRSAGYSIDGIEYQASYLPRYQKSLRAIQALGVKFVFDPMTYRLQYSSYAQTEGVESLPYIPVPGNILVPAALQSLQSLQRYTRGALDWQMQWGSSVLVPPFHFSRDLASDWIDVDIKILEESRSYAAVQKPVYKVFAGLCLNIEAFTIESNRMVLLNRYSRAQVDGYMFYMDNIDEKTANPLQLSAYLDLLRKFQQLGKPVFACRVGTLGLGLLAAGVDGCTTGIASLASFSENNLLVNRAIGYDMSKKYYIPKLLLTLPVTTAHDILRANSHLRCSCPFCSGYAISNLERVAKTHYLYHRTDEIKQLNAITTADDKKKWFAERVVEAINECRKIRRTIMINFSHLNAWQETFCN